MRALTNTVVLLTLSLPRLWAAWENLPPMAHRVVIQESELEVDAGLSWAKRIKAPKFSDNERPVLVLRARLHVPGKAGGCNYVLQVLFDGVPLCESVLKPRLLNKPAYFDPPGTKYHFSWFSPSHLGWMTIFSNAFEGDWGGTGRDYEFVFDVSEYVASGETIQLSFRHLMPTIPAALKLARAPLVVEGVTLGVMQAADVERLRAEVQKGLTMRDVPIDAKLPADAKAGDRAYEIVWSGRKESPPAQVVFEDLSGWTLSVLGDAKVSLAASVDHLIWRRQVAKLSYGGGTLHTVVVLRPPKPIPIPERFDAANLWLYSMVDRYNDRRLQFIALVEDRDGREFQVDLGPLTSCYWNLLHGVLNASIAACVRWPVCFTALVIANCNVPDAQRRIYIESLAFYQQNRKPYAKLDHSKRSIFPTSDDGMLPTPPKGVKVSVRCMGQGADFISKTQGGTLRFRVQPRDGCMNGVTAQWNDAPPFRPMEGGGIAFDFGEGEHVPTPDKVRLVSSLVKAGRLTARWRLDHRGGSVQWEATYSLRGRTLIIDLRCAGGSATGVMFGQVAGLPNPRGIEVPYLTMGYKPGPWIACASGVFASVLPDWYHSDFSSLDATVTQPTDERIGLFKRTLYTPLTNGQRNDLRERVLVTVSSEFADTLPNARNPVSPNRNRLAPYAFFMGSAASLKFYATLKRYGVDHLIASDFATVLVDDYSEGFSMRWRPHPLLSIGKVQELRRGIKALGYLFSFYLDATDYFPCNEWFDENKVSLTPEGDWCESWYGNFALKPNAMPLLVRLTGEKVKQHYPPDCVYLDVHTNRDLRALDYEAGVEGAGMARSQVIANGDCILEARKWYGSTISEGISRWLYAGLCDMDYATLYASKPAHEMPPLVDFDLLKIHPFQIGTMMGYAPTAFLGEHGVVDLYKDPGSGAAPTDFYKYLSASLAYGHSLILGYGYIPALARFLHYYALMQGVQREYLTDHVREIHYHNGSEFTPTSRALMEDTQKLGRVRVRYSRGLTVHVNYNAKQPWTVKVEGRRYELPPFGWVIVKPGEVLAYSALVNGRRVDFVRCPDYIYLNSSDAKASEAPLEVEGAALLKRHKDSWRLIPCGNLGRWERFAVGGMTRYCVDYQVEGIPADRGCKHLVVDTKALLGKPAGQVRVTGRNEATDATTAKVKIADENRLKIVPDATTVDYLMR